jgi:hypothetical protein
LLASQLARQLPHHACDLPTPVPADDGSSDEEARSYSGWAAPPVAAMSREVLRSMPHRAVTDEEVQCQAWVPGLLLSLLHRGQEAYKHLRDLLVEEDCEEEGPQVRGRGTMGCGSCLGCPAALFSAVKCESA